MFRSSTTTLTKLFLLFLSLHLLTTLAEPILLPRNTAPAGYGGTTTTTKDKTTAPPSGYPTTGPVGSVSPTTKSTRASPTTPTTTASPTKKPTQPTCGPSLFGSAKQNTDTCLLDVGCTCLPGGGLSCNLSLSLSSLCILVCACL